MKSALERIRYSLRVGSKISISIVFYFYMKDQIDRYLLLVRRPLYNSQEDLKAQLFQYPGLITKQLGERKVGNIKEIDSISSRKYPTRFHIFIQSIYGILHGPTLPCSYMPENHTHRHRYSSWLLLLLFKLVYCYASQDRLASDYSTGVLETYLRAYTISPYLK